MTASTSVVTAEVARSDELLAILTTYERGVTAAAANAVLVGTNLVYAYGVHEGRRRSGRLARRAGGAFFLTRALEAVTPRIGPRLAAALPDGPGAVVGALHALGLEVEAAAKGVTPVVTGSLRRSIHTELARRR